MFDENVDFSPKVRFTTKIVMFDENVDFSPIV